MKCKYCKSTILKGEQCTCSGAVRARNGGKSIYDNIMDDSRFRSSDYSDSSTSGSSEMSDINLDDSCNHNGNYFHEGVMDKQDDNLCNHNGNFTHVNNSWNQGNPPPSSPYQYREISDKVTTARKTGCIVAVVIFAISFLIPIVLTFFTLGSFNEENKDRDLFNMDKYDDGYHTETDEAYDSGQVIKDVYYNYWADIEFKFPKHFEEASKQETNDYYTTYENTGLHIINTDDTSHLMIITYEDAPPSFESASNSKEVLNSFADAFSSFIEENDLESSSFGPYDREIAGNTYCCYDYTVDDEVLYLTVATRKINKGYIYIIANAYSEDEVEDIFESIKQID